MARPLVANMLASVKGKDDIILLDAAVRSIAPVVDGLVFLDTTPEQFRERSNVQGILDVYSKEKDFAWLSYEYSPRILVDEGFGVARNNLLERSPEDSYVLWADSDEIHFSDGFLALKRLVLSSDQYDDISINFVHFCIGSNYFERIEPRIRIFRKSPGMHWEGRAHEKLCYAQADLRRRVFFSDYGFHHYGYLRSQDYIRDRWNLYHYLEKDFSEAARNSIDRDDVPFYDESTKEKDSILEDRKDKLIPYFGEYPQAIPREWIEKKRITL